MPRKTVIYSLTVAQIAIGRAVVPAWAGGGHEGNHGNNGYGTGQVAFCPPGLAKKNPPCVPPGLAKSCIPGEYRQDDDYWRGYYDGQNWLGDGDHYG